MVDFTPGSLNEWGALGGVIGRLAGNYWAVPVIEGGEGVPKSDQLKHFGAAMASFGSTALFSLGRDHARGAAAVRRGVGRNSEPSWSARPISMSCRNPIMVDDRRRRRGVLGAAAQPSYELRDLAALCDGRRFTVPLLAVTRVRR